MGKIIRNKEREYAANDEDEIIRNIGIERRNEIKEKWGKR